MSRDGGKLTYERDFLLQFQTNPICMLKPEGLPDLEIVLGQARPPSKSGFQQKMLKTDAGENMFLPSYLRQNSRNNSSNQRAGHTRNVQPKKTLRSEQLKRSDKRWMQPSEEAKEGSEEELKTEVEYTQIPVGGPSQMQYKPQQAMQGQFAPVSGPSQPQGPYGNPQTQVYPMGQPSPPVYIVRALSTPMTGMPQYQTQNFEPRARQRKVIKIKDPNSNKDVTQEIPDRQHSGSLTDNTAQCQALVYGRSLIDAFISETSAKKPKKVAEYTIQKAPVNDKTAAVDSAKDMKKKKQKQHLEDMERCSSGKGNGLMKAYIEKPPKEEVEEVDEAEESIDTAVLSTASELEHAAEDEKLNGYEGRGPLIRRKDEQEENFLRQFREMPQQLIRKDRQYWGRTIREDEQEENFRGQLREVIPPLREKDEQGKKLQRQLKEMEEKLTALQKQCKQKELESSDLERQLRDRDQDLVEVHKTLSETERKLEKCKCQEKRDWIIPRDDILITDKSLGRGAWGYVHEGKYCGCTVAVKKLHEKDLISPCNRGKFEREMDIASRCRHPCLLQFIGATNDEESPLFDTELMELSLRQLLNKRPLFDREVVTISLDVARALSYLHKKRPSPILHRDVSSPNVLLWRRGNQWRAKVSDYGTANFLQDTMTANPGAMIYSAPEACARTQTVKIDVYSFGVLLCEMCTREMPEPDRRDAQVQLVKNPVIQALVRRCVQSAAEDRPSMEEIIEELEQLNGTS